MLRADTQVFCLVFAALSLGAATSTAQAYLDPGTGSMILQIMLGGVAGVALAGKLYWQRLVSLFRTRHQPDDKEPTSDF
jgi:hypothetical protein